MRVFVLGLLLCGCHSDPVANDAPYYGDIPPMMTSLTISPQGGDFGTSGVGRDSAPIAFTVAGTGDTGVLTTTFMGANASDFKTTHDSCNATKLADPGSCEIDIVFHPTTSGAIGATAIVSDGPHAATVGLSGEAVTIDDIATVSPNSVDLGAWAVGATSGAFRFSLTNIGGMTLGQPTVSFAGTNPTDFVIASTTCTVPLAPAATCVVDVQLDPTATGSRSAILLYATVGGATTTATILGTGLPPDGLAISPVTQDFGSIVQGSASAPVTFTITNTSATTSSTLVPVLGGPAPTSFAIASTTCGAALAPAGTCTVAAKFAPATSGGSAQATLTVGSATAWLTGVAAP